MAVNIKREKRKEKRVEDWESHIVYNITMTLEITLVQQSVNYIKID